MFSPLSGQHLQYNTHQISCSYYPASYFLTHFNGMCSVKCYYCSHLIA
nr:MAG TPA: Radical SAM superfamily [Crassvirales sp.]